MNRIRNRLRILAVMLCALVVLTLAASLVEYGIATAKLKRAMVELGRENIPTTWAALERLLPQRDPDRKGQVALFAALDLIGKIQELSPADLKILPVDGWGDTPPLGQTIPEPVLAAMERRMQQTSTAMQALRAAVDEQPYVFRAAEMKLQEYSAIREAARLSGMEGMLDCAKGETNRAVDNVVSELRLARLLDTDPTIIGGLIRIVLDAMSIETLERTLAATHPSPQQTKPVAELLELERRFDGRLAIMGEIVGTTSRRDAAPGIKERRLMLQYSGAPKWLSAFALPPLSAGWIRMNQAIQLDSLRHELETWSLPWPAYQSELDRHAQTISPFYGLVRGWSLKAVRDRTLRLQGLCEAALAGLAAEAYQQDKHALPDSLNVLVPQYLQVVPASPFTGQPMEYVVTNGVGRIAFFSPTSTNAFEFRVYKIAEGHR